MKIIPALLAVVAVAALIISTGILHGAQNEYVKAPGILAPMAFDVTYGSDDAEVKVIMYYSFGCIYCRGFLQEAWPAIREDFVDTGNIQFVFRPIATNQHTFLPAVDISCAAKAERTKYFEAWLAKILIDHHFRTQEVSCPADKMPQVVDALLSQQEFAIEQIGSLVAPTFLVGPKIHYGAPSLERFGEWYLDELMEGQNELSH